MYKSSNNNYKTNNLLILMTIYVWMIFKKVEIIYNCIDTN